MNRDSSRCGPIRDLLAELIYGELDESSEREVRLHIEQCQECRQELADLERIRAVMRSSTELELPAGLEARVMSEARQALPAQEEAGPESAPSGLRALLSRLLATPAFKPALAASLTALLIAGIAWMVAERRGSVIERHVEKRTVEPVPSFEAPAAPPREEEAQELTTAPPPYPTPGVVESKETRADEPAPATPAVDGVKLDKEAPRSGAEKDSSGPYDLLASVATSKTEASGDATPAATKKAPAAKLAEIAADEDAGMVAGGTKSGTGASTLGGYAAGMEGEAAVEEHTVPDTTLVESAPKKPAPAPASPPPSEPSPGAAPPLPTYMQPAADMEDDEVLEAEETKPAKAAGSSGKKSLKQKWADYKAKKKAEKEAKKAKKKAGEKAEEQAKNKGAAAESIPAAAAQAPADKAQDPFDAAMSKKKAKDYEGCVSILAALKKSPSSTSKSAAKVHHQLAWCTAASGDAKKALVLYENLLAKHPSYAGRHQAMMEAADLYAKLGDKKGARALLEKLLDVPAFEKKARKKLEKLK